MLLDRELFVPICISFRFVPQRHFENQHLTFQHLKNFLNLYPLFPNFTTVSIIFIEKQKEIQTIFHRISLILRYLS